MICLTLVYYLLEILIISDKGAEIALESADKNTVHDALAHVLSIFRALTVFNLARSFPPVLPCLLDGVAMTTPITP